ncbi:MAG: uncharacterized membrane protein YraQ (UPF0718 family)/copper chaperone CopZ [Polyangiales bacterium]
MSEFVNAVWIVTLELAPWLLLGSAVAGLLHVLLPPGFVQRNLQGRGGVFKAVALGVPLPLCSCGVIPAGLGLKRDGASDGASVAFLISTPQTGVDSVLVSASMLGWPFALFKVVSAALLGIVGGLLAGSGQESKVVPVEAKPRPTPKAGVAHSVDMLRSIWGWLVFGVLASAAITVLVPAGSLASLSAAGGLLAMGAVLAISVPLYVCATASVPIAAALVAGGFPPGAALVFLIAGPATNVATLGAVYGAFGKRILAAYLSTIVIGSVVLGSAFDFLLDGSVVAAHVHGSSPFATVSAIVLCVAIAFFAMESLTRRLRKAPKGLVLSVEGMTCGGCAKKVEGAIREVPGVSDALVSFDEKSATVGFEQDDASGAVIERIEALGYTVTLAP